MTPRPSPQEPTTVETPEEQATAWVLRLASGEATVADANAINLWREASDANRRAFAEANLLWNKLGPAAKAIAEHQKRDQIRINKPINRRAAFSAAFGAAAAASYLFVHPPLHLWASAGERAADLRTGTGEQRKVTLFNTVSVTLNTETALSKGIAEDKSELILLISGEAAFSTPPLARRLIVEAGNGIISTFGADFQVRNTESTVCITCLAGQLKIRSAQKIVTLEANQQVTYGDHNMQQVETTNPVTATAWQRGMLIFDNAPLADVVKEINRYRSGRIILLNQDLAQHPVVATFHIDQLNLAVSYLQKVFNLKTKTLPGEVTVLS